MYSQQGHNKRTAIETLSFDGKKDQMAPSNRHRHKNLNGLILLHTHMRSYPTLTAVSVSLSLFFFVFPQIKPSHLQKEQLNPSVLDYQLELLRAADE